MHLGPAVCSDLVLLVGVLTSRVLSFLELLSGITELRWNVSSQLLTLSLIFQQHSPTVPRNALSLSSSLLYTSVQRLHSRLSDKLDYNVLSSGTSTSFAGLLVRSCHGDFPHQLHFYREYSTSSWAYMTSLRTLPIGRDSPSLRITICCFLIASPCLTWVTALSSVVPHLTEASLTI